MITETAAPARAHLDETLVSLRRRAVYEVQADGRRDRLFGPGDPMVEWHLVHDAARLRLFAELLGGELHGRRILDLGANPYILTYALASAGASVVAGGYPRGDDAADELRDGRDALAGGGEQVEFVAEDEAERLIVPLACFDVERHPFPFSDGFFDAVICGELIEHLATGPDHLLRECNRVLRHGGRLVLSSPNAVSLSRLVSIARGVNPEWPYSAQGIHARHNRNYTLGELRDLLYGNGIRPFAERGVTWVQPRTIYAPGLLGWAKWLTLSGSQRLLRWQEHALRRFADGVVVAGIKTGAARTYRPAWLFGSADGIPLVAGSAELANASS